MQIRIARRELIVLGVVAIGLAARLIAAASSDNGNYDQRSYEIVVGIMRRGGNVYAETQRYNYSPVWAYLLLALDTVARAAQLSLHFTIGVFLTLIDLVNAALIGRIAAREGVPARVGFAAFLLNPVAVLISAYQGQFETLAALPVLATLAFAPRLAIVWLLGTAAVIVKHLLTFAVWTLYAARFGPRRAIGASAATGLIFIALLVPFALLGAGADIVGNVFLYRGLCCFYGFAALLPEQLARGAFAAVMIVMPLFALERLNLSIPALVRLSATALVAFIPGFGQQYFLVPVLFAAYAPSWWYAAFSAAVTAYLASTRDNINVIATPFDAYYLTGIVWAIALVWTAYLLRSAARAERRIPSAAALAR